MRRNQMMPIAQHFNLAAERPSTLPTVGKRNKWPSRPAGLGSRAFGEGSAKGTFADAAPLSSQSRNALPSGVICQPEQSRKTNL